MATKFMCNGCTIEPKECIINGKKSWRWVVTSFTDDCFENGELVDLNESGKTKEKLFNREEIKIETDLEFLNDDLYSGIECLENW